MRIFKIYSLQGRNFIGCVVSNSNFSPILFTCWQKWGWEKLWHVPCPTRAGVRAKAHLLSLFLHQARQLPWGKHPKDHGLAECQHLPTCSTNVQVPDTQTLTFHRPWLHHIWGANTKPPFLCIYCQIWIKEDIWWRPSILNQGLPLIWDL